MPALILSMWTWEEYVIGRPNDSHLLELLQMAAPDNDRFYH